jgi:hypothetical protein
MPCSLPLQPTYQTANHKLKEGCMQVTYMFTFLGTLSGSFFSHLCQLIYNTIFYTHLFQLHMYMAELQSAIHITLDRSTIPDLQFQLVS